MNIKQALKRKNVLVDQIKQEYSRLNQYNSIEVGNPRPYAPADSLKKYLELTDELVELKTSIPQSEINEIEASSEEVSPMSLTITELQKRAEERRQKMKGFNYKFTDQMNKNIDEIERQPAYKRLGVNLDESSSIISKSKAGSRACDSSDRLLMITSLKSARLLDFLKSR